MVFPKKAVIAVVIAAIVIIAIAIYYAFYGGGAAKPYELKIFTGGTGGVYYPIGTKLADMINKYSEGRITASAQTSGASVANARALAAGDANMVFIQNDIAYYAYKGIYMFNGSPVTVIRGVAALYPEVVQIVVRADSGIRTIYDLAGKRVAVGAAGSGTAVEAELILRAAGVWDKIAPQYLDFAQAADALKLGQVDAAFVVAGVPASAVLQLATTTPIRLLEVPDEVLNTLRVQGYMFFVRAVIPKDAYPGLDRDVNTVAVKAIIAVRSDVPDDVVYTVLKIMFDHLDELRQAHARAQDISLDKALDGMSIPLHPGAVKFYREKGISIPSELLPS